ncbi:MAG TPA: hypothetical protein VFJ17_00820 [Mycobacteriales bacterium]|nr:hypothetical protein [Mycobacteriales bacterium]
MTNPGPPLPPRVVAFIRQHVDSLLQLESLLLIVESGRQPRSAADVSAEMYLPESSVAQWLDGYVDLGFCERVDDGYRVPDDAATYELLSEVGDTYVRRKVSVGRLVFGPPVEDPKIALADAFRLRRDRDDRKDP